MFVHEGPPSYGAYLLRYWEVRSDSPGQASTWRFSLEKAGTGERRAFRDLEALVAYLRAELAAAGGDDNATGRWGSRRRSGVPRGGGPERGGGIMKRRCISLALLIVLVQGLVGPTPAPMAQVPEPDAPAAEQGSGMPGWPAPQQAIPYHEPGRPSKAAGYTTQVTEVDAEGVRSTVQLSGLDAMTADGIDPLAGNYRVVESAQIMAGANTYAADMESLMPASIGEALVPDSVPGDVAAGDLNGDGIDEQITAWLDGSNRIRLKVGSMPGQGRFTSAPAAISHEDGTVDLLARGLDGSLYHSHFNGEGWSTWENRAGGTLLSGPAAVSRGAGRFDVFALGVCGPEETPHACVYHARWAGGDWDPWGSSEIWQVVDTPDPWPSLEGMTPDLELPAPAVTACGDRLDLFRLGPDHTLVHLGFDGAAWDGAWESLGGMLRSPPTAVAPDSDHVHVLALGVDGALWHRAQSDGSWGRWERLAMPEGVQAESAPTAVSPPGSDEVSVYVRGANGDLWAIQYIGGSWQGWVQVFDVPPFEPAPASAVGAAYREGQVDLFVLTKAGTLQWRSEENWSALQRPLCEGQYTGPIIPFGFDPDYGIKVEAGHFEGAGRELIAVSAIQWLGKFLVVSLYSVRDGFHPEILSSELWDVGFAYSDDDWSDGSEPGKFDFAVGDVDGSGADSVLVGYIKQSAGDWYFCIDRVWCSSTTDRGGAIDCSTLDGATRLNTKSLYDGGGAEHIHLAAGDIKGDGKDGWAVVVGDIPEDDHESRRYVYDGAGIWDEDHNVLNEWSRPADVAIGNFVAEGPADPPRDEVVFVSGWAPGSETMINVYRWDPSEGQLVRIKSWDFLTSETDSVRLEAADLNRDVKEEIVLDYGAGLLFGTLRILGHDSGPDWKNEGILLSPWLNSPVAAGDFRGDSLRVGAPTYRVQEKMTTPIMFLNQPPMHRDIVKDDAGEDVPIEIFNDASAVYTTWDEEEQWSSTTSNREWSLSTGFEMSVGGGGSTVTTSFDNTYGESFSKMSSQITSVNLTEEITADLNDQVIYNATTYGVWEYPVLGVPEGTKTGPTTVVVVYPLLSRQSGENPLTEPPVNREYPKSCNPDFYAPAHQTHNVWSYDPNGEIRFADYAGEYLLYKQTSGGSTTTLAISGKTEEERTSSSHNQISAGLEYSYQSELSVPLVGNVYDFSFRAYANGSYGWENISTFGSTLAEGSSVTLDFPSSATSAYDIDAYLYEAKGGYWVLAYQAEPDAQAGYWQYYDQPDPAFILNWYGWPLETDPVLRYPCGQEKQLFSHDVTIQPRYAELGEQVTISATVRNFSPVAPVGPVTVRFYRGDPALNEVIGVDTLTGLSRVTGPETASIQWTALGAGEQRIYAVIDPENAVDEMHDEDDLINNNTAYGLLYVAGADYLDPGLKKEMPYQEIKAEVGPGLEVTAFVPTVNSTETLRFELVPTPLEGIAVSGGLFRLDVYEGGEADPPPSYALAPVPAVLEAYAPGQDITDLKLYRYSGTEWTAVTCAGVETIRFPEAERMFVPVCQLTFSQGSLVGTLALSDERPGLGMNVFLPLVMR